TNPWDPRVAYKHDRYRDLGTAAAKLDDAAGFVPARLTGLFLAASAGIFERLGDRTYSGREALRIFRRDRLNHKSPNSAHSEAAAAGALGLKLGGGAYYFGKWVEKPSMGDEKRPVEHEDVKRTQKLMYGAAGLTLAGALAGLGLFAIMRNRD
ncbi:MAG: cobalamin biosynthesis protein, partial [Lachnospiraceae bacterium]|nr:cobalamin biosynthesis protein [Lachnospiraceae bacterium]